ncbi:MAG: hypothetical protein PF436_07760 [Prolixibacteraceae bacterium]|jgi:hypothetical protein|nr:hypothetical protein [Prolixibacteraceae bacterium]
MKKNWLFVGVIIIALILISCGEQLNNERAKEIISEYKEYPEPYIFYDTYDYGTTEAKGINKIVSGEYVYLDNQNSVMKWYKPTEKGKDFIQSITYSNYSRDIRASFAMYSKHIKTIDEILVDKEKNIAIVKYTLGYVPLEPIYSYMCPSKDCYKKARKKEIKLKKYDKGWRVLE